MKILISGICGFVGSSVARALREVNSAFEIVGCDNFSRAGSQINRVILSSLGIKVIHADIRQQSDVDNLPASDWIIDAAANPSVKAGIDGSSTSRLLKNLQSRIENGRETGENIVLIDVEERADAHT